MSTITNAYYRGLAKSAQESLYALLRSAEKRHDMEALGHLHDALMGVRELGFAVERLEER